MGETMGTNRVRLACALGLTILAAAISDLPTESRTLVGLDSAKSVPTEIRTLPESFHRTRRWCT